MGALKTPDEALLRRARALDPGALAEIYERYLDGIYRYVYARVGHQADAEDLTEQVFLKMVDAIPGYRSRGIPFASWLYRIAHNLVVDRYRRAARQTLELREAVEDRGPYADPHARVEFSEQRRRLIEAIQQLTPDQQQVIRLRFIDNLEVGQVAGLLRRRPGAIHALRHRALNSLLRLLRAQQPAEERVGGGRRG